MLPSRHTTITRNLPAMLQLLQQLLVHLVCRGKSSVQQRIVVDTATTSFVPARRLLPWPRRSWLHSFMWYHLTMSSIL